MWATGIWGVFPDEYRSKLCYANGEDGLYIFRFYNSVISDTIYSLTRVNLDGTFTVNGDTYVKSGTTVNLNGNSTFNFDAGRKIYVDGVLLINSNNFNANSKIICRTGGKVVICPEAVVNGLHTMIIDKGGTL